MVSECVCVSMMYSKNMKYKVCGVWCTESSHEYGVASSAAVCNWSQLVRYTLLVKVFSSSQPHHYDVTSPQQSLMIPKAEHLKNSRSAVFAH